MPTKLPESEKTKDNAFIHGLSDSIFDNIRKYIYEFSFKKYFFDVKDLNRVFFVTKDMFFENNRVAYKTLFRSEKVA